MVAMASPPPETYANWFWCCSGTSLICGDFLFFPLIELHVGFNTFQWRKHCFTQRCFLWGFSLSDGNPFQLVFNAFLWEMVFHRTMFHTTLIFLEPINIVVWGTTVLGGIPLKENAITVHRYWLLYHIWSCQVCQISTREGEIFTSSLR